MTNVPNDTTPNVWAVKVALGLARGNPRLLSKQDIADTLRAVEWLEAELNRLAGPVCGYDDKHALEHSINTWPDGSTHLYAGRFDHPPAPAIEAWLKERSGR